MQTRLTNITPRLSELLAEKDPEELLALLPGHPAVHFTDVNGYDALIDAAHAGAPWDNSQLLQLLRLLISEGAALNGLSKYGETALGALSRWGKFEAVQLLLDSGADPGPLKWTPLIKAVALGSLAEVEALLAAGADLEATDGWSRTAWLVSLMRGDLAIVQVLADKGANTLARGKCGKVPLAYAVDGQQPEVVRWLLAAGSDVDAMDDFKTTPLMDAVERDDLVCIELLISAGADVNHLSPTGSVLAGATSRQVVRRLLDLGADPQHLSKEGRRALLGLQTPDEGALLQLSAADYQNGRHRYFGRTNPEKISEPFWDHMIRSGSQACAGRKGPPGSNFKEDGAPVWCADRFGQSLTFLPDGRMVQVGGEHEDHYDPDFCIYNDVFVHSPDGSFTLFGYPEAVFPPTDFHTATLVRDAIYLIGSLGYRGSRHPGTTPFYRLDLATFRIDRLMSSGEAPGWISRHQATLRSDEEIVVRRGKIVSGPMDDEKYADSTATFVLDLKQRVWRREFSGG